MSALQRQTLEAILKNNGFVMNHNHKGYKVYSKMYSKDVEKFFPFHSVSKQTFGASVEFTPGNVTVVYSDGNTSSHQYTNMVMSDLKKAVVNAGFEF